MKLKGLTNKVTIKNNLVTKVSQQFHDFYLDKKNEFAILEFLKTVDQNFLIAPVNFYWDNERLVSQFEFLEGFKTLAEIEITEEIVEMVSINIKKLHQIEVDKNKIAKFRFFDFLNTINNNTKMKLSIFEEYLDEMNEYCEVFQNLEFVLSHNDLVPGNILVNQNKVVFIDYDYTKLNNKFFDLASFITETLNSNENLIVFFIEKCIEKKIINHEETEILNKMIKYQDLLWTLWANMMFEKTNKNIFKEIFEDKIERLKNRTEY